jgi:predicted alpha/beta superfamily hydrolase
VPELLSFDLHAERLDAAFHITVSLPITYGLTEASYPVLYVLDAHMGLGAIAEHIAASGALSTSQELIVVGVGYPEGLEFAQVSARRLYEYNDSGDWDLTSSPFGQMLIDNWGHGGAGPRLGGAAQLLHFLTSQLRPEIERRFRTTQDAGLIGTSAAGNFVLWSLFQEPSPFTKYIALSPSLAYGNGEVLLAEERYASSHDDLAAEVYMAAGSREIADVMLAKADTVGGMTRLAQSLFLRGYPSLSLHPEVHTGATHHTIGVVAMLDWLPKLWPPASELSMTEALLRLTTSSES